MSAHLLTCPGDRCDNGPCHGGPCGQALAGRERGGCGVDLICGFGLLAVTHIGATSLEEASMSRRDGRQASNEITRRTLLTPSAVGVAAASTLNIARAAHVSSDETIKIAYVGCGGR